MKRLALAAAVVLFAACAPKAEEAAPAADANAMAAPAAPMTDTASMAATDTTKKDTTAMKADTTKH
jgi:uncharacterized lipoprotein YajG